MRVPDETARSLATEPDNVAPIPDGSGQPDPRTAPPVGRDLLAVVPAGFEPHDGPRRDVIVIGAGLAGLVAAYELKRAGHRPIVLEAQSRVGGRIHTLRSFAPGLVAEAGGMRIPRTHALTLAYCDHFGLPMRPFLMGNPRGLVVVGGERLTMEQAQREPGRLGFQLAPGEQGRTADELWESAIAELRRMVDSAGPEAWEEIVRRYDQYSLLEFLEEQGWSQGAIEYYAVLNFVESDMHQAFLEILREDLGGAYQDMQCIEGGMDQLPNAFFAALRDEVHLGTEVTAIEQDPDGVTVHVRTGARRTSVRGDAAICTLPFPVLRTVEVSPAFSRPKQRAIRQLNYHASTKILMQVRERIWETDDGILGGATVTDLPIRRLNYPPPDPTTSRGILLASYTWGQDALQWGAMDEETRLEEALDDVARIHPRIREVYETGTSYAWYGDRWARGAFALFQPGQQTELQEDIVRPEGRILFAGEHCSLYHAWIQGALESGLEAARTIHEDRIDGVTLG
ncbi:MAG: flavin monoamine oxidase family protein [Chloroflexi bacterium]|nr:flavin monoamine oxidase family protein [Chloroflexota bacterium]